MSIVDFPEDLTQAMLVGTMLVGRLGVHYIIYALCYYINVAIV